MAQPQTSRRQLFGAGASLMLITAAAAGATKACELDGELFAACAAFDAAEARLVKLCADPQDYPYDDPRCDEHEAAIDATNDRWDDAAMAVAACVPRTPEGLQALVSAARTAFGREVRGGLSGASETLVGAALEAVTGRAQA